MQLILIRHGETVANVERRWVGWRESGLTDLGRAQVEATARRLAEEVRDGAALYTSPLLRAWETAAGIGRLLGLEPVPIDDLREINFGRLDGISLEEMASRYPDLYARWQDKTDTDYGWPGGERRVDFFRRVAAACEAILARHDRGTVLVVGHGGTLRSCLAHLLPEELGQWWTYSITNCGITRVVVERDGRHLLTLNDIDHLPTHP